MLTKPMSCKYAVCRSTLSYCTPSFLYSPVVCPLIFVFQTPWVRAGVCYVRVQYLLLWIEVILHCHVVNNWFSGPCSGRWLQTAWSYLGCWCSDVAFLCFSHFHLHHSPSKLLSATEIDRAGEIIVFLWIQRCVLTPPNTQGLDVDKNWKHCGIIISHLQYNPNTGSLALCVWRMSFYDCVELLCNVIWWLWCQ